MLNVGDVVTVTDTPTPNAWLSFVESMEQYCGKSYPIKEVGKFMGMTVYMLEGVANSSGQHWMFIEDWLEFNCEPINIEENDFMDILRS